MDASKENTEKMRRVKEDKKDKEKKSTAKKEKEKPKFKIIVGKHEVVFS